MSGPPPRPRKAAPPQSIVPAKRARTKQGAAAITEGDHLSEKHAPHLHAIVQCGSGDECGSD